MSRVLCFPLTIRGVFPNDLLCLYLDNTARRRYLPLARFDETSVDVDRARRAISLLATVLDLKRERAEMADSGRRAVMEEYGGVSVSFCPHKCRDKRSYLGQITITPRTCTTVEKQQ